MTTADTILAALQQYNLVDEGGGKWRCDSPLRPGSNSHAFCLKIDGPEHGTWMDQVSGEAGSLYELAGKLGLPTPGAAPAATKRGYSGLDDYAQAHGVPGTAYTRWGWHATTRDGRAALEFPTASGPRWRFLDGSKPPFTSPAGYTPCWYGLGEAAVLAQASGQALVLCNGEASVVAAQHHGVAAASITNSGERPLPPALLAELLAAWAGPVLVALDCDAKGRGAAPKLAQQLAGAGLAAQVVDLGGASGFDLADFCQLHGAGAIGELRQRAQAAPAATPAAGPGAPPSTISGRLLATLAQLGYTFRLNLLSDEVEVNGELISDVERAKMRTSLRDLGVGPIGAVDDTIIAEAAARAYHPIREYLDALVWDGTARLGDLAACFASTDDPIVYADGRRVPLLTVYLGRWLIGAVAKVYEQAQNLMFVLVGPQGSGKSTFARWLCSPLPHLHIESAINVTDKDTDVRLMSYWIWEVGELDATTRKQDVSALKEFVTRGTVTVRKSYGRHDVRKPAVASLIGTVNESDGFLADTTGNRRFLVATITAIDPRYQAIDINQVWAEVLHLYRQGASWRLTPEEMVAQVEANRRHEVGDPLDGWLEKHFFFYDPAHDISGMTTADIIDVLRERDVPVNADRAWETRIGAALRKRQCLKKQVRTGTQMTRRWYGVMRR